MKWNNLTTDELITKLKADITALSERYLVARANYEKCKNGGLIYPCRAATGKTQSSWYETMKDQEALMRKNETELARLQGIQTSTVEALKLKLQADILRGEADIKSSEAGSAQATHVGKWIFIGVGALGLLAVIYFKFIKKRK